jgi:hypothetical protein
MPAGVLRVRLFTTHFSPVCAAAFPHEASCEPQKWAVTIFCAVLIVVPAEGTKSTRGNPASNVPDAESASRAVQYLGL